MNKNEKIFCAGHRGMVGSAIVRALKNDGYNNIVVKTHQELDLTSQLAVNLFFQEYKPQYVFLAAARVGGILANDTYRAEFIYDNLMIEANVIHAAYKNGVKKLLALGSSCIYPRESKRPLIEEDLMSAPLEPTNEPYAIAKIAGIKLCEAYRDQYGFNAISLMPPNLYGQGDSYGENNTHVLPSLMRRFHQAKASWQKEAIVWGSGEPYREFMYCDDMADACIFAMQNYNERLFLNVGTGVDIQIKELAEKIKKIVGYEGEIIFDKTKPDGTMRKLLDSTRINDLGWRGKINLDEGLQLAYKFFKQELNGHDRKPD
jgi:GDP-L-fucose synthase